jgi:hypothetical protein
MKKQQLYNRIIISFEGADWGTKLAPFINDKIKALPKTDRKWLFATKSWSVDAIHNNAIDSWVKDYWDNYKHVDKPMPKNRVNGNDYDINEFLEQFN